MRHPKSLEARQSEAECLYAQVLDIGLPEENVTPVLKLLDDFKTLGYGTSEKIKIPGTPWSLDVHLSGQAHITSYIRITRT